tara:strand:- start:242 stop:613 length:372 start_codon:yes stop_codon:yes gene_type:complete
MPKELTGNRIMKKKMPKDLMAKKSLTQMPGSSKRQRADTNMTRAQEKRLVDEATDVRKKDQREEDRMNMPSMMKKGGKVKKMKAGGMTKKGYAMGGTTKKGYKKGGKIRGYGIARGGKVCKMR